MLKCDSFTWFWLLLLLFKALDILNDVPHVDIQNDNDIEGKLDELVSKIKGNVSWSVEQCELLLILFVYDLWK